MTSFSAVVRALSQSRLATELSSKLDQQQFLDLNGVARLPKGLVTSAIAQLRSQPLCIITATLEEASRWAAQLESMGWNTVHFYPTSEASPYEPFDLESEMAWGQLQILADLSLDHDLESQAFRHPSDPNKVAIVATERSLQPHLPPKSALKDFCLRLQTGMEMEIQDLRRKLAHLGYEKVALVETEGQWSQRGDILDIYPVAAELPIRLEWFGEDLEQIREFDPGTQRSLDRIPAMTLTPTSFRPIILKALQTIDSPAFRHYLSQDQQDQLVQGTLEGTHKFLGFAFDQPASLLDYLPDHTLIVLDEPGQCQPHSDRWVEHAQDQWTFYSDAQHPLPKLHQSFSETTAVLDLFDRIHLRELAESDRGLNLSSRPVPVTPHQFGKLAEIVREQLGQKFQVWLMSAQPSRSVALLQEHDAPAQFVPNPKDYPAIEKLQNQRTPVGLKYSGLAELEGFILPTFRVMVVTDREFFGQHSLSSPSYVRKRRRAASKQVDPNKLSPGDYVVHRNHGIGQFKKLESLTINRETRDYLVIQYADGLLRVAADQLDALSRFRTTGQEKPQLHKMTGKVWEKTKNKVRKSIKKLAVDLIMLYAERAKQTGFVFPEDQPWQEELEESFPYVPTPDQLKATQDVKRDMESNRPMDRLVCGDVGFGKTEVAVRAIFKAVTAGKQVAMMAPTTILTQQHYHTLKERFAPYPIQVGLLNRFRTAQERKDIIQRLKTGELDVVVGTQQLLGKTVQFKDLGLLVIDEEQRFGVNQKEKIKTLKTQVDVLTLSATPIPRTLYMALSGVREMSLISTPPPSRRPIKTHMSPYEPETVRSAIRQELDRGGQVFYVVPRVEGIEETAAKIREMVPSARIAIAHGQMVEGELEATMLAFSNAEADILLCTTIIESGLDIPRVNTILIEDAQKFGLSQLYQLRGRVGRAGIQAHAWLFYPRQESLTEAARKRLRALQEFTQLGSGYQLAMRDMEIRGVGNLLGAEQSGQLNAIGFDLYMDMLQESINEIRGQEIPQVDETSVELTLTAFIPSDYIPDLDQKMAAYREVATADSKQDLTLIAADWSDRYGTIPHAALQLMRVVELKLMAKPLGFAKIKSEGKQHVILETPMEEPAWKLLQEKLPNHLKSRFVYSPGKVTVRGLGVLKPEQQLENLIDWLGTMQTALPHPDLEVAQLV
ncbi:transcription-repair coupling factor [Lyngbya confervoides]|uniref:Transcription-repair-coupling factor n=1 Tax=Lyngbya confervoides BDU141951 TaxID=1574623 RepID=A0ABD4T8X7_9CYAN|nr:transcription-repair coupling factor [Lyngbya confervoides]MCM1985027.1 transcription-repair coupling factor [Lyngbya confervoides BDU141951]